MSGWLEVKVYGGLWPYSQNSRNWTVGYSLEDVEREDIADYLRWCLYKAPSVTVVERKGSSKEIKTERQVTKVEIDSGAKETLELDTICGTCSDSVPTAKGLYLQSSDGMPLGALTRGQRTGLCEELLAGLLLDEYGSRSTVLKGTVSPVLTNGLLWSEPMEAGKLFVLTGVVEDAGEDEWEVTLTEIKSSGSQA